MWKIEVYSLKMIQLEVKEGKEKSEKSRSSDGTGRFCFGFQKGYHQYFLRLV